MVTEVVKVVDTCMKIVMDMISRIPTLQLHVIRGLNPLLLGKNHGKETDDSPVSR